MPTKEFILISILLVYYEMHFNCTDICVVQTIQLIMPNKAFILIRKLLVYHDMHLNCTNICVNHERSLIISLIHFFFQLNRRDIKIFHIFFHCLSQLDKYLWNLISLYSTFWYKYNNSFIAFTYICSTINNTNIDVSHYQTREILLLLRIVQVVALLIRHVSSSLVLMLTFILHINININMRKSIF